MLRQEVETLLDEIAEMISDTPNMANGPLAETLRKVDVTLGTARAKLIRIKQCRDIQALLGYLIETGKLVEQEETNHGNTTGNR